MAEQERTPEGAVPLTARDGAMSSVRRYVSAGEPPRGLITVFRRPDGVFVEAFDTLDATRMVGPTDYRALCYCFKLEGQGINERDALRDLEIRLQRHLSRLLKELPQEGDFEAELERRGFTVALDNHRVEVEDVVGDLVQAEALG